ncbi:MAG: hypothetical protein Q9197_007017, partial [Variospora fuerteventurae]
HRRPFTLLLILLLLLLLLLLHQQLPLRALSTRRLHPILRHYARQYDPNRSRAIHPTGRRLAGQFLAQGAREMVAIVREQVVARAREGTRDLYDDGLDLAGRAESHALEERAAECTAGGLEAGRSAVDAGEVGVGVSAEGEFAV